MEISDFIGILLLFCMIQGIILIIKYSIRKHDSLINRTLSCIILLFSLSALNEYLFIAKIITSDELHELLHSIVEIFLGPLSMLFCLFFTKKQEYFKIKNLFHLIFPCCFIFVSAIMIDNSEVKFVLRILSHLSIVLYLSICLKIYRDFLKKSKVEGKSFFSNKYFKLILFSGIATFCFGISMHFIKHSNDLVHALFIQPENFGIIIFIISLEILSIIEIENFFKYKNADIEDKDKKDQNDDLMKYQRNRLNEEDSLVLFRNVNRVLNEKKYFKYPNLAIDDLTTELKTRSHVLSQVINRHSGTNFNTFINKFRIDEVKRIMNEDVEKHKTVTEIYYEAGFNSKSTFNKCFKSFMKQNPSEYRKKLGKHL